MLILYRRGGPAYRGGRCLGAADGVQCVMRELARKRLGRLALPLGAGVLMLALTASLWALTLREQANRRLYLEYEVHKVVTAMTDLVRFRTLEADDVEDVIGFGLYALDGGAVSLYGEAPASMNVTSMGYVPSSFTLRESSVVMIRSIGGELLGRRTMMGPERMAPDRGARWRDLIQGRQGSPGDSSYPPPPPSSDAAAVDPRTNRLPVISYIEFSTQGFLAEQRLFLLIAVAATVAVAGLYLMLLAMNRGYAEAKDREARDRELVELGQAARTIAHEIKNPLGVIRIQCGLLKRGASTEAIAGLTIIDDEALRLAALADRIRSFLKSGDAEPARLDARAYLEDFAVRYQGSLDAAIGVGAGVSVLADEARLTEALDNLVSNAIDASRGAAEPPRLEAAVKSRRLVVSVLDRGGGVPAGQADRIFEPFFTTKERGSGLGLALARKNVEAGGGQIAYADRPGGGAAFTVSLPLA